MHQTQQSEHKPVVVIHTVHEHRDKSDADHGHPDEDRGDYAENQGDFDQNRKNGINTKSNNHFG